jgi:transcriptional regulator with XRE-family HTH domain
VAKKPRLTMPAVKKRAVSAQPSTESTSSRPPSTPARRSSTSVDAETEGQRRLLEIDASLAEIGRKVGCSKALAGYWRQGMKLPSSPLRDRLFEEYGIPPKSWERAPGAEIEHEAADAADEADAVQSSDPLELVNSQIATLQRELRNKSLSETARSNKQEQLTKNLSLRVRIERDATYAEEVFLKGPRWRQFKERLLAGLRDHPAAAKVAADALLEAETS